MNSLAQSLIKKLLVKEGRKLKGGGRAHYWNEIYNQFELKLDSSRLLNDESRLTDVGIYFLVIDVYIWTYENRSFFLSCNWMNNDDAL